MDNDKEFYIDGEGKETMHPLGARPSAQTGKVPVRVAGMVGQQTTIKQAELTSDCWLIQIQGINACLRCEAALTPECGGERVLKEVWENQRLDRDTRELSGRDFLERFLVLRKAGYAHPLIVLMTDLDDRSFKHAKKRVAQKERAATRTPAADRVQPIAERVELTHQRTKETKILKYVIEETPGFPEATQHLEGALGDTFQVCGHWSVLLGFRWERGNLLLALGSVGWQGVEKVLDVHQVVFGVFWQADNGEWDQPTTWSQSRRGREGILVRGHQELFLKRTSVVRNPPRSLRVIHELLHRYNIPIPACYQYKRRSPAHCPICFPLDEDK